jgi:hypothetical protein
LPEAGLQLAYGALAPGRFPNVMYQKGTGSAFTGISLLNAGILRSSPMSLLIIRIVVFCFGIAMIIYANVQFFSIAREVNLRLDESRRLKPIRENVFKILRVHRCEYPTSRLRTGHYLVVASGFASLLASFLLGFMH